MSTDALLAQLAAAADQPVPIDLAQPGLCEALLESPSAKLHDLVGLFLHSSGVYADARTTPGPPKWQYSDDPLDSFDRYMRYGCPNCGAAYPQLLQADLPTLALQCHACGHRPAPMHTEDESESVMDRLVAGDGPSPGAGGSGEFVYLRGSRRVHDFGQNEKAWWQQYYLSKRVRNELLQGSTLF